MGTFKTRSYCDRTLGDAIGVPMAVCRSMAEWAHTEHAYASNTIVEVDDPQHGRMRLPGAAVRLSGAPAWIAAARRPLDADRDTGGFVRPRPLAVPTSNPSIKPATSALAGLRVLDLTQIWAGPTAGRALAEYGADVIKINSPHEPVMTHVDVNRGKRTILLDLATPQDLDVFWRLLDTADVVMQNFRFGAAERLGVGYEQVRLRGSVAIRISASAGTLWVANLLGCDATDSGQSLLIFLIATEPVRTTPELPFFVASRGQLLGQPVGDHQVRRVFGELRRQLGWVDRIPLHTSHPASSWVRM